MTVQLALYKGRGKIGNAAVRAWTGSIYSHCELVIGGFCYSSSVMDGGVRRKKIDLTDGKWDLVDLPWADAGKALRYFHRTDHHTYGWLSLISAQLFNRNQGVEGTQFCSEWCANATYLPNPSSYGPGALGGICKFLLVRNCIPV